MVFITALVATETCERLNAYSFTTYAIEPSVLIATEVGLLPVATVAIKVFEDVSITPAEEELPLLTKTRDPLGVAATQFGNAKPGMLVSRAPVMSWTVTEFEYWLLT